MPVFFIALICCSGPLFGRGSLPNGPVDFTTILAGAHSTVEKYSVDLITNNDDWEETWLRTAGNIEPLPQRPSVDFRKEYIIAAFMGERPSSGFKIEFKKIEKKGKKLIVYVARHETPGMLPVVTHPFNLVRIPRGEYQLEVIEEMVR